MNLCWFSLGHLLRWLFVHRQQLLDPPRLLAVSRGTFEAWMKSRGQLGGQHKVPRIVADEKLFASLRELAETRAELKA